MRLVLSRHARDVAICDGCQIVLIPRMALAVYPVLGAVKMTGSGYLARRPSPDPQTPMGPPVRPIRLLA